MNFPFPTWLTRGKAAGATVGEAEKAAQVAVEGIFRELPDSLLIYVAEVSTGRVLASYSCHRRYSPNQLSLRNARLLALLLAPDRGPGGPVLDLSVVLNEQLHHLRPFRDNQWYCFAAVLSADTNLGILKEITRRHTS